MNLDCIMNDCFSVLKISASQKIANLTGVSPGISYSCMSGFDHPETCPNNCESFHKKFICPGGLSFRSDDFTNESCHECKKTNQLLCRGGSHGRTAEAH